MIRFVFFDVGGTLIKPHPSVGEVYALAGRPHGLEADPADLDTAFRDLWERRVRDGTVHRITTFGRDDRATRNWWRALVDEVLDRVGFHGDRDGCFEACYAAFATPAAWRIFADVRPTLQALSRRALPMGILSNWDHRLRPLLTSLGLASHFRCVVVSALEGLRKPDVAFFRRACETAGVRPEAAAHVGDSHELDVQPARALGMRAFLIDRISRHAGADVLTRLDELPARLLDSPR